MDTYISNLVQNLHTPAFDIIMLFFTYLVDLPAVLLITTIVCLVLWQKNRLYDIVAILLSLGGGESLVWTLKHVIGRARPFLDSALVYEESFSFPSGHAFFSVAFYGLLVYFLFCAVKSKILKFILIVLGVFLALMISFSRVYIGVHWPTDVLAGLVLGTIWLVIIIKGLKKIKERK